MNQLSTQKSKPMSIWLGIMCFSIIFMVFIGGLTRLTESGLSITEWNPVSGTIPPLNNNDWNIEFDKYKLSPEYIHHNSQMDLGEFKSIYLLEFFHRLAGRITGLIYLLPLLFFYFKNYIKGSNIIIYLAALTLLAAQGFMGWYMVKSGLVSDPHVSHYRLALHLMFAVFLYIIVFWQLMRYSFSTILTLSGKKLQTLSSLCLFSIVLTLIQMALGAFVAGLDAGLVYNEFPMMGDSFVPHEISSNSLSFASFNDPVFLQFIHRITAYLLFAIISVFCILGYKIQIPKLSRVLFYVFLSLSLQITLGIITLIYSVPILFALLHQICAIMLLSCLLWAYFLIKNC